MTAPVRHYCRNSRCRMKLAVPVDNERRAFCTPACHASFYRHRCIVCEKELPPGPANRKLCKGATCRREYRRFPHVYHLAGNVQQPLETPIKSGLATRPIAGRASTTALRFASLPVDPAARVTRDLAKGKDNPRAIFQRHAAPLNLIGGHSFTDVPKLKADLRQAIVATERTLMLEPVEDVPHDGSSLPWTESFLLGLARAIADSEAPSIVPDESGGADVRLVADDDLAIPEFLRRAITKETTSAATVRTPEDVCPTRTRADTPVSRLCPCRLSPA
jgi:hypothetical protein